MELDLLIRISRSAGHAGSAMDGISAGTYRIQRESNSNTVRRLKLLS